MRINKLKAAAMCCVLLFLWENDIKAEKTEISEAMSLGEGIAWNVYAEAESVEFEINGRSETVTDYTETNGRKRFVFRGMGPKMLADELTVTAHLSGGKTRVHKISAREYLIKNYGKSEALDALTDALLSYGAAVQIYENYRTDCLACNIGTGTVPENSDTVTYIDYDGIYTPAVEFLGASVILGDIITVSLHAEALNEDGFNGKYLNVYLSGNSFGTPKVTNISAKESVFSFGMAPTRYSDIITAYFADETGTKLSPVLTYSVKSYIARMYGKTSDPDLKNLLSAFEDYCAAAEKYVCG